MRRKDSPNTRDNGLEYLWPMLFRMRNEDEVLKLLTDVFPTGPNNRDGKVLRKGLRKLSPDREQRGQNANCAKPKRGAKEVWCKGENSTS